MQIKLPVHEKRSQLSTLPSQSYIPKSIKPSPCVPIQPSLPPYQTQSNNAHLPSQESHLPSQALQQPSFDVFLGQLRDMKHQMSPDAADTKCNVAKSHEQHVGQCCLIRRLTIQHPYAC